MSHWENVMAPFNLKESEARLLEVNLSEELRAGANVIKLFCP
jgi:hypothetical protein